MEKFVPYEKLSKRKKKEIDRKKRSTWGIINPTTRKTPDPKEYKRKKFRFNGDDDQWNGINFLFE